MFLKEAAQELPCKKLRRAIANNQYEKRLLNENLQTRSAQGLTLIQIFLINKKCKTFQVSLEIFMDGNLDEKSLFFAAIATATLRATAR